MEDSIVDLLEQFNQFDWVVTGLVLVSGAFGLIRGFAREATSVLGWVGAFVLANVLALPISETMVGLIDDRSIRYLVSWVLVFIAVVFLFGSIGRVLSKQLRQPGLNFGNRLLGAGLGMARGVVIAAILALMLRGLLPESERTMLKESELIDPINVVAAWLADNFEDVINGDTPPLVDDALNSGKML